MIIVISFISINCAPPFMFHLMLLIISFPWYDPCKAFLLDFQVVLWLKVFKRECLSFRTLKDVLRWVLLGLGVLISLNVSVCLSDCHIRIYAYRSAYPSQQWRLSSSSTQWEPSRFLKLCVWSWTLCTLQLKSKGERKDACFS